MSENMSFRRAFNGFNREDVVRYIEYLNSKNSFAVNQLKSENQSLLEELEQLRTNPEQNLEFEEQLRAKEEEIAQLKQALAEAEHKVSNRMATEELEAYRRAERMERAAQERTQQIYRQVTGTLAETATQVDEAADQFKRLSQVLSGHMAEMQDMVDRSRNALLSASATMYSIRPTAEEE